MRLYSNGKLLISGEYAILDGALSLAAPTLFGQYLDILEDDSKYIKWTSKNANGKVWFQCRIYRENLELDKSSSIKISNTLIEIIKKIRVFNPNFLTNSGANITTKLTFDKDWGLGSSSTLISNLSKLAEINPFKLNNKIFNGSGYDIACAMAQGPILYQRKDVGNPLFRDVHFDPPFKAQLYFIYLNEKQDSQKAVATFDRNLLTKEKIKLDEPGLYDVVFLNDSITTMEFVVKVLKQIFGKTPEQAKNITTRIHEDGQGIVGSYTHEVAEQKGIETTLAARQENFPLQVKVKKQ